MDNKTRCGWVSADPLYIAYHDEEWGQPLYDGARLFEMLCLEGQQAGLSWITVLKKRENYRRAYHHFDPEKVAAMTEADIDALMQDAGLIRHRLKLDAIVINARALLAMQRQGEDFSTFLWSFVDGKPLHNHPATLSDIPAKTAQSDAMSKALKKRGFKFIGSTICYAFMQACGMVDDHVADCFLVAKAS
ncbi:DNA-3-methyladenine glycosylase I [Enterobacillus tribolii]|uniref:DNA-3-methyladenine glycosylase I n=1 Tax=Enterobacillus tribolii TaxID=1487935 RepID=A0A370QUK2_9GAMM|nr:DNA-3-methyladenine glycosylase I [Enterobacillus tribolii]MBW7981016.1 DNA-3-methyladenine glycosylase I [Enterobacillus tribolii]RDK92927.1 DNA-3-methyladenine glycosylase I [Enterobacillus tribolii]